MNIYRTVILSEVRRQVWLNCICSYAKKVDPGTTATITGLGKKKKLGKGALSIEKKVIPVETDPTRLVNYVCGTNLLKEGGEDIQIKPDSEYPDWLWNIRTGKPPPIEEMDPNTKQYWIKVRTMAMKQKMKLLSLRKF